MHISTPKRLGAALVITCAVTFASAAGITAVASPVSTIRAIATRIVPQCKTTTLRAWFGKVTGAAGTIAVEFGFTNASPKTCSLYGYPHVQMLTKSGANLSTTDKKATGSFGIREKTVVLATGKTAYFGILYADQTGYPSATCPTSAALKFTPPQNGRTITAHKLAYIAPYGMISGHLRCGIIRVTPVTAKSFQ